MLFALIQEKKDDLADDAQRVAKDLADEPTSIFTGLTKFLQEVYHYISGPDFIGNVLASLLVVILGIVSFRLLTRGLPRILQWRRRRESLLDGEAVARIKRQDTAITLMRNALRYVVFIIVVLLILSIFFRNPLPAAAGTTIIAAIIGFGAQSFLRDVIAGFSIVFEGQYSVGDFVTIKPQDVSGIVEELGLRMTKIR